MKAKIDSDSPEIISFGLDGWSQHHHGYLGINGHYLNPAWERVIFNLACTPFDVSHTAENIFEALHWQLYDWDLTSKAGLCLRDNAFNMKAAFELDDSYLESVGCINHSLQLVIKEEIFALPSVEKVIKKCKDIVTFANSSNKFYPKFYHYQVTLQNITERLSLKGDVSTRYSTIINSKLLANHVKKLRFWHG